jgi:hypothetical protein
MIAIFLALTIQAHAMSRAPLPIPSVSPSPIAEPVTIPSQMPGTHPMLVLKGTKGATPAEIKRIESATARANRVLASPCFKQWVLAAKYSENKGMTQAQIYALLSKAPMELTVEIFDGSWKENHVWHTVAYEGTGAQIRLNRYYLGDDTSISATEIHERGGHGNGFQHEGVKSQSVPYGLQWAMEGCA